VNTVQAITPLTAFKIPLEPLTAMLRRDADLQFRFLCKTVHALRETQRQAVVVTHRDPTDRIAAFLSMLEAAQQDDLPEPGTIPLPMTARDIAEYVDLSVEDVKRGFDELRREGAIERLPNRAIRVANRRQLNRRLDGV
jgi:CRP-like cAMP-binding protein